MSRQDLAEDYIRFLISKGSISHIVKAPPESSISTLALTQRCLASGLEFPVPLPDGSVAICIPGEVPKALAALDLVIEPIRTDDVSSPDEETTDSVTELERIEDGTSSPEEPESGETPESENSIQTSEDGDPAGAPEQVAKLEPIDELENVDLEIGDQGPALEQDEEGPAVFVRSGEQVQASEVLTEDAAFEVSEPFRDSPNGTEEVAEPVEVVPEGSENDALPVEEDGVTEAKQVSEEEVTVESTDAIENASGDMSVLPVGDVPEDDAAFGVRERVERLDRILSMLAEIEARFAALEDGQSAIVGLIDSFGETLDRIASRQVPRPDTSEFNRGIAKLSTVLAQTLRRVDETIGEFTPGSVKGGSEVAASLSQGLSALADAVRATQDRQTGTASELAMISSMQETLSHQLAKLLETSHAQRVPVMEEFLLDVRHATAELLAEQARVAKAS